MPVYHVLIGLKSRPREGIIKDNILESELLRDIVEPYNRGEDFRCDDEIVSRDDISSIKITESERARIGPLYEPSHQRLFADRWQAINRMKNVTDKFIKTLPQRKRETMPISKNVFIVHGRDHKPMKELKAALKGFGLNPIILHEQPSGSRTIVEKLEKYSDVGYAFVILTPDDVGIGRDDYLSVMDKVGMDVRRAMIGHIHPSAASVRLTEGVEQIVVLVRNKARQNVILEFGYFMGLLGRDRVCCLYKEDIELPSDMHGIVYISFKESINEVRDKIIKELKEAGYQIKM